MWIVVVKGLKSIIMASKTIYLSISFLFIVCLTVLTKSYTPSTDSPQNMKYLADNLSQLSVSMQANLAAKAETPTKFEVIEPPKENPTEVVYTPEDANQAVNFCGEPVPLHLTEVDTKFKAELQRNLSSKGGIYHTLELGTRYKKQIIQTLKANGLPEDFYYLAIAESGLNNLTSPKGAKGFWQFMEDAATRSGLEISETVDERFHPEKATLAACKYLKTLNGIFHNWTLTAAAYNMGAGALLNNTKKQGTKDYYSLNLNSETARYVYRILSFKYLMEQPGEYGLKMNVKHKLAPIPYLIVKVDKDIPSLAEFAKEQGVSYAVLKTMNAWLVSDRLDVKPGKTYEIRIPKSDKLKADELVVLPYQQNANRKALRDSMVAKFSHTEKGSNAQNKQAYTF